jgi:hypothetical protein
LLSMSVGQKIVTAANTNYQGKFVGLRKRAYE